MKHQRGYALLTTAVIIMLGITITALFTSRSMSVEQRSQNDNYRAHQAFEAAEAGLEFGIAYLLNNKTAIVVDANSDGFIDTYTSSQTSNVAFNNNTTFNITYSSPVVNSLNRIKVQSVGTSDNGTSSRTVVQLLQVYPYVPITAPAPLIVRGNVDLSGNVTITNTAPGTTIWSGGTTGLSGAAITDTGTASTGIVESDTGLSSMSGTQFFEAFFGTTKALAEQHADIKYTNGSDTNYSGLLDGVTNQSIWINQTGGSSAQLSGNATIGSAEQPVVLVVNGPLLANGVTTIYGMVYVVGDWNNTGGGTLNIIGSAVVEGSMNGAGTPNVTYDTSVLTNLNQVGAFTKIPGTWRDF